MALKVVPKTKPVTAVAEPEVTSEVLKETETELLEDINFETLTIDREALATQILALTKEVEASGIAEKIAEIKNLKDTLSKDFKPDEGLLKMSIPGLGVVQVSKAKTSTVVDQDKLKDEMGVEAYLTLASVGVTDAKKYLEPEKFEKVSRQVPASRSVTITAL